jgi:hypothetical protein
VLDSQEEASTQERSVDVEVIANQCCPEKESDQSNSVVDTAPPPGDIGVAVELKKTRPLTDKEILFYLTKPFTPTSTTLFEKKVYSGKTRSFQLQWLEKFNGLVYSKKDKGAYCKFCVLFSNMLSDARIASFGALVVEPLKNWKKATEKLQEHFGGKCNFHNKALELADNFKQTMSGQQVPIHQLLESSRASQIKENRQKLMAIIDTIITCGRQGIALRGHRDDHTQELKSGPNTNLGNFVELLKFRVRGGDTTLESHLKTSKGNARYTSKSIQNEVIDICGNAVRDSILRDVKDAEFFSVIADEATDSSNSEQLAISIRYVDKDCTPQECFLGFSECLLGVTGEALANSIISNLQSWKFELHNLRGQSYDGAGAMAGTNKGAAARVMEIYPKALYTHCASHRLNLCIAKCCNIREVQNSMEIADKISRFFNNSPKRQLFFESFLKDERKKKLKELCRTRWVERHDAFDVFIHLFKPLVNCLEALSEASASEWSRDTRQEANVLYNALLRFPLIVALILTREVFLMSKVLSIKLQGRYVDIARAHKEVELVKHQVEINRREIESYHKRIYDDAVALARDVGVEEEIPRIAARQQHRANPEARDPCQFFRRTITAPLLDHLSSQLQDRFDKGSQNAIHLSEFLTLLPSELFGSAKNLTKCDIENICSFYDKDMPSSFAIDTELQAWCIKWNNEEEGKECNTIPKTLAKTDKLFFPNLHTLLRIAATLPVTSCTCERSISTLRLLKTRLRSTMTNNRLNGLAMLFVHRERSNPETQLDMENIVNEFAALHPRRMELADLGAAKDDEN